MGQRKNVPGTFLHRPIAGSFLEPSLRDLLLQGGGVLCNSDATVTFTNTQIHGNQAVGVRLARDSNLSRKYLPSPRCGKFQGTDVQSLVFAGLREMHRDSNRFPELSFNAPLRVVSWNLHCGIYCHRVVVLISKVQL